MGSRVTAGGGSLVLGLALFASAAGCPRGDLGAPCNHGPEVVPKRPVVTFPALACDDLLCVFAEDVLTPADACTRDADCNESDPAADRFACIEGHCTLRTTYVLDRSMCSRRCSDDGDCARPPHGSACASGFACARIQQLGDFCCEKLCVCRDDLDEATAARLEDGCSHGTQQGCCDGASPPPACGS